MAPAHRKASKAVRRKYNIIARLYDYIFPGYSRKTIRAALGSLDIRGEKQILDIGCGTGELEKILLQKNPKLTIIGIDLSDDMLRLARKKLGAFPNVTFTQGDFLNVDLEESAFDVAFSLSNLHYFPKPAAIFEKVAKVLKKGGRFVIVDWNRESLRGKIYNWYMNWADPAFGKAFTIEEATALLEKNGLQVEKADSFRVGIRWSMMRLISKKS